MLWLILVILAWSDDGPRGAGGARPPLALASAAVLVDIAVLGNIGRWWMTPRWPGRDRTGWWGRFTDPLRWPLPVATLAVLIGNLVLTLADQMIPLHWLSLGLCVGGLALLGMVATATPRGAAPTRRSP